MLEVWLPLLLCMVLGGAWFHVLRLRERAILHARRLCEQHGLQLLDDSVALHRLHARWHGGGLQLAREYRFETSLGGDDRQAASITVLGGRVVAESLPQRSLDMPATAIRVVYGALPDRPDPGADDNVVPIGRPRRTFR